MRYKVQLPDYPYHHVVTGLRDGTAATGKKLGLAEASAVLTDRSPPEGPLIHVPVYDLVTQMLLHDAIAASDYDSALRMNDVRRYGHTKDLQALAYSRIANAEVESLE